MSLSTFDSKPAGYSILKIPSFLGILWQAGLEGSSGTIFPPSSVCSSPPSLLPLCSHTDHWNAPPVLCLPATTILCPSHYLSQLSLRRWTSLEAFLKSRGGGGGKIKKKSQVAFLYFESCFQNIGSVGSNKLKTDLTKSTNFYYGP